MVVKRIIIDLSIYNLAKQNHSHSITDPIYSFLKDFQDKTNISIITVSIFYLVHENTVITASSEYPDYDW